MATETREAVKSIVPSMVLSHGTLICQDMNKTRKFYTEFLGLEVVRHGKPAMMFRLGTGMHVVAVQSSKPTPMHVLHHWGVDVETKEDVQEAHANALKYQEKYDIQKVMNITDQHGVYSFYLQDMDLNWWEVQYAPNQHDDCFNAGDIIPWED